MPVSNSNTCRFMMVPTQTLCNTAPNFHIPRGGAWGTVYLGSTFVENILFLKARLVVVFWKGSLRMGKSPGPQRCPRQPLLPPVSPSRHSMDTRKPQLRAGCFWPLWSECVPRPWVRGDLPEVQVIFPEFSQMAAFWGLSRETSAPSWVSTVEGGARWR